MWLGVVVASEVEVKHAELLRHLEETERLQEAAGVGEALVEERLRRAEAERSGLEAEWAMLRKERETLHEERKEEGPSFRRVGGAEERTGDPARGARGGLPLRASPVKELREKGFVNTTYSPSFPPPWRLNSPPTGLNSPPTGLHSPQIGRQRTELDRDRLERQQEAEAMPQRMAAERAAMEEAAAPLRR
eukprot:1186372-Prorocentrum_minimum.AAC.1